MFQFFESYMVIYSRPKQIHLNCIFFLQAASAFCSAIKHVDTLPVNTKSYVTGYLLILTQYLFCASSMLSFGDEGIKKDA